MIIQRYSTDRLTEWDAMVEGAKNGTFLFRRAYMDYHADRFCDHSLMYYSDKGRLLAIMPANEVTTTDSQGNSTKALCSHQGLTYGGLVLSPKTHISEVGEMMELTMAYLREHGFSLWRYKQVPTVYHRMPADEDEYWLWRMGARMTECNMMTAIDLREALTTLSSRKQTYCNRLRRDGFTIDADAPMEAFWPLLSRNLEERFGARPVHSLEEIKLLQGRFPQNIRCCTVKDPTGTVVAGTVLFITDSVVRTQYISASHEGKRCNALDYLMLSLTDTCRERECHYLEFGTSMAEDGTSLNSGLILQKEGFGGRAIACRTWEVTLSEKYKVKSEK